MDLVGTGVEGLDEMLGGGIPRGHVVALLGSFGTGKTTFALQFLMQGLINGERGIFITLEEDVESILKTADAYGWDLRSHTEGKAAALIKLEPADAKATATRVRSELPEFIKSFKAQRIAIDSVSLLSMMFPDEIERRTRLFSLCDQIRRTGATAVMTAEVKDDNPRSSRDGLVEYVSDGVISLRLVERTNGEVQPAVQIVKMRRLKHDRNIKPYSLTEVGAVVHTEAEVFG
ncbi:MAG: KaiC domain-containing protein [Euryarchaeota archaeon RBG_16_68_13]|nr:MAG: KaiC domain-containing protein [Euryarchaeota archaeon RBG_16_68_13]